MSELTRRRFVSSSASAVAGMTVAGALLAERASAAAGAVAADRGSADAGKVGRRPIVVLVRDPRKGEIEVMTGEREIRVKDRKLAAQIARVAR